MCVCGVVIESRLEVVDVCVDDLFVIVEVVVLDLLE